MKYCVVRWKRTLVIITIQFDICHFSSCVQHIVSLVCLFVSHLDCFQRCKRWALLYVSEQVYEQKKELTLRSMFIIVMLMSLIWPDNNSQIDKCKWTIQTTYAWCDRQTTQLSFKINMQTMWLIWRSVLIFNGVLFSCVNVYKWFHFGLQCRSTWFSFCLHETSSFSVCYSLIFFLSLQTLCFSLEMTISWDKMRFYLCFEMG